MRVIFQIIFARLRHGTKILYYPPAGSQKLPLYRDLAILLTTRWLFTKTVFHFHACGVSTLETQLPRWIRPLFRLAYHRADGVIRSSLQMINDGEAFKAKRDFVVPLGIPDPGAAIGDGRKESVARLLFIGVLCREKGLFDFLAACGRLAERGIAFEADVVGDFVDEITRLEAVDQIEHLEISSRIHLHGVLVGEEKNRIFANANVLCFPSFHPTETFGLVLLEAMSFGLPIVATRWRGVPEIVDDNVTGLLVDVHNTEALATQLERLLVDPALRKQLGDAGREKFVREYTAERFWNRMENVFLQTAGADR
jgi:glycosyltransferase involved in cell wall biosynthesis